MCSIRLVTAMVPILAIGCAGVPAVSPASAADTIRYETGACFGACPVYTVTIRPDGYGIFVGKRFTAVTGEHQFRATRAQYRAFAAALASYRPSGEVKIEPNSPLCGPWVTDQISIDVRWNNRSSQAHLDYYFGCDETKHRAMAAALSKAPSYLPIADFIRKR